ASDAIYPPEAPTVSAGEPKFLLLRAAILIMAGARGLSSSWPDLMLIFPHKYLWTRKTRCGSVCGMGLLTPDQPLTSADSLGWINLRVSEDASLTRHRLAKEVCVRFDLRDAKGRPREMACRKQLLVLERRGRITLPPPRHKPPVRRRDLGGTVVWPAFEGTLADLGPVSLRRVTGGTEASRDWNTMMRVHHPQGDGPLCGAQIRYLL